MTPLPRVVTPHGALWRIGRVPQPWAWADWDYAGNQRWDDADFSFRTVYAADSRYTCFVEVFGCFRPDPSVVAELQKIRVNSADTAEFPSLPPGEVPQSWVNNRRVSSARVAGLYCDVTAADTIAALRPHFLALIVSLRVHDFDAAAIKSARPRELTQRTASYLYQRPAEGTQLFDGVRFASRFGDDLLVWAIFERSGDNPVSCRLTIVSNRAISRSDPDLRRAFLLHGLRWAP